MYCQIVFYEYLECNFFFCAYLHIILHEHLHAGLTCGLFMRKSLEIHCPDSGLCIQSRDNQVVKVITSFELWNSPIVVNYSCISFSHNYK